VSSILQPDVDAQTSASEEQTNAKDRIEAKGRTMAAAYQAGFDRPLARSRCCSKAARAAPCDSMKDSSSIGSAQALSSSCRAA